MLFQYTFFGKLNSEVETCLPAKCRKQTVRLFLREDLFKKIHGQWLYVNTIRNISIGHNGRRVAVDKHYFQPVFFQSTTGLRTCIVKFCCLPDDNRPRPNDHDFP